MYLKSDSKSDPIKNHPEVYWTGRSSSKLWVLNRPNFSHRISTKILSACRSYLASMDVTLKWLVFQVTKKKNPGSQWLVHETLYYIYVNLHANQLLFIKEQEKEIKWPESNPMAQRTSVSWHRPRRLNPITPRIFPFPPLEFLNSWSVLPPR